jgi:membrane-bound lytic murein transglycosylase B
VEEVKEAKGANENEKKDLDQQRTKEIDTKVNVEAEERKIRANEAEKKRLLNLNAQEQKNYQAVISDKQKKAAAIRNALFPLRDTADINFGQALQYAKEAANVTGIRPAFLLAVITQESNLGKNIGSCYLTDEVTGAGVRVGSGAAVANVMKPGRDVAPFISITKALGRDPFKTLVSCPFQIGYGGAMGPAQFIASTWSANQARIGAAVGKSTPDPWNPRDAFMASALYLTDLGAGAQTYTAERNAACRYYSGRVCSGSNEFYGNQVLNRSVTIQSNIDILQN